MKYTIIPTRLSPLYRIEMPWDEYLAMLHVLRGRKQQQLIGFINNQMRQTGDGKAHLHLQHAEFEQVKAIVAGKPETAVQSEATS